MNENRMQILQMLSAGQITAEEAERLIAALENEPSSSASDQGAESHQKARPKYIRVLVEAQEHDQERGPTKVNVRVPMQLLRAGVKLASLIPAQARDRVNVALREKGMQFDLNQIKPENLEEIIDQMGDLTVDVDDKNAKVRVFCE
jgi:hypothetical protein